MIRILNYDKDSKEAIFDRGTVKYDVSGTVSQIIKDVSENGDEAVKKYCEKFDGARLDSLLVTDEEIEEAFRKTDKRLIEILERAAHNISDFHSMQMRNGFEIKDEDGRIRGQKVMPIEKVGLYVPGGTAAYPSTVLMNCIPAKIAGCSEIVIVSPPGKDGRIAPAILAAAKIAGADKIFKVGGAQAVAALAYGTESIPKVHKIVGPGNAFVAEAKRQVFGLVAIDMIAGPSEILVVADEDANPDWVAADLLSQAEHDAMASAVMITNSPDVARKTAERIEARLNALPRRDIAGKSIESQGKIIVAPDLSVAVDVANDIAPEHLELYVKEPFKWLDKIRNAGSVFLGANCPEALGDYFAGPNHTLPTSGTAKFSSPLSVDDFIKKTQYIYYTRDALEKVWEDVQYFAEAEGLSGHGRSIAARFERED